MFNIKKGNLFPTDFYCANIFEYDENEKYKNFLIDLSKKTSGKVRSNRGGWQSDTNLWNREVFKPLLEKTTNITQSIIGDISDKKLQMVIRSMWGNINPKGGMNFTHIHPSGWMSGVYYIQLPKDNNIISFEDPRPARMMDFQRSCLVKDEYFDYQVKVGDLILFPSWLPHFVLPNTSEENRISISFNIELLV
jgi:uncharacterized protein (TIGR02466 family)